MSRESSSGRRMQVSLAERSLLEGEQALRRGEAVAALAAWSEALATAQDPALREELAGRVRRTRRRLALRRLAGPALLLGLAAPLALAGLSAAIQRREASRQERAASALEAARARLRGGAVEPALEAFAGVARDWRQTAAADAAVAEAGALAGGLERARAAADAARAAGARGAPGEAAARLDEALEALAAWPWLPQVAELRRAREEARTNAALLRGREALEEGDPAQARALFAPHAQEAAEARRGLLAARWSEAAREGAAALERAEPGVALPLLREANALARRLGQPERDLRELEEGWAALRRVRALARLDRAAEALAEGDLAAARSACGLPPGEAPEEPALERRLAALGRLAASGLPEGMLLVPGGRCPRGDTLAPDELPLGLVEVEPFLIDRREVTRGEVQAWLQACGAPAPPGWQAPTDTAAAGEPARGLTWHEARAFAAWAGKRLPTETEWEAAARLERPASDGLAGPPGDERAAAIRERFQAAWEGALAQVSSAAEAAWSQTLQRAPVPRPRRGREAAPAPPPEPPALELPGDVRPRVEGERIEVSPAAGLALLEARRWPWGGFWDPERCRLGGDRPRPAGPAGASPWGVEDLAGSVAEWTASEYRPWSGPLRSPLEGKGRRVVRGGSFRGAPGDVRASVRAAVAPEVRFDDLGFRCVRDLPPG